MADRSRRAPSETARALMIRRFGDLAGYAIGATDGDVGGLEDLLFDESSWTVRHLVVDTGSWLSGRRVLISPHAVTGVDSVGRRIVTSLTRRQVEGSPGLNTAPPVSRQQEVELATYYGYPFYWEGPYRWGPTASPAALGVTPSPRGAGGPADATARHDDPHLHSAKAVIGYGIQATDGELGHVEDFLVDEESWAVRYLIVDPRNWWPNAHVLIGVEWLLGVSWERQTVAVRMTRDAVRDAPEWRPERPIDRHWETELHRHHGREGYWERPADRWRLWPPAA